MKRSFRELYKRIAESKWFRKSYRGKSLGDEVPDEQPVCEDLEEEIKSWHKRHFKSRNAWEDYSGHYLDKNSQLDLARHFYELGFRRTAEKYDEIEYKRQRADVCEGLGNEIDRFRETEEYLLAEKAGETDVVIARHFYELGRQSNSKVSEELETEVERCVYKLFFDLDGVAVKGATHYLTVEDVADIARHFAQWGAEHAKEQMMKEAVEGEVVKDINNKLAVTAKNVNLDKFKFGERVKIIIVKED